MVILHENTILYIVCEQFIIIFVFLVWILVGHSTFTLIWLENATIVAMRFRQRWMDTVVEIIFIRTSHPSIRSLPSF